MTAAGTWGEKAFETHAPIATGDERTEFEESIMKYMLMMNTPRDGYAKYMSWPKQLIAANTDFMRAFAGSSARPGNS
jgi:hypothetical protein